MAANAYTQGRIKELIIRSGLKVYPAKVESVLKTHAKVADAAVVGRADPVHTEIVVAFIVRKNATELADGLIDELRAHCRQHLAPYEVPAAFELIELIPRSPLGKVLKKELRTRPAAAPSAAPAGGNGKVVA